MWWFNLYLCCAAFVLHHLDIAPEADENGRIIGEPQKPKQAMRPACVLPLVTDP